MESLQNGPTWCQKLKSLVNPRVGKLENNSFFSQMVNDYLYRESEFFYFGGWIGDGHGIANGRPNNSKGRDIDIDQEWRRVDVELRNECGDDNDAIVIWW